MGYVAEKQPRKMMFAAKSDTNLHHTLKCMQRLPGFKYINTRSGIIAHTQGYPFLLVFKKIPFRKFFTLGHVLRPQLSGALTHFKGHGMLFRSFG